MVYSRFGLFLAIRLMVLMVMIAIFSVLMITPGYPAASVLVLVLIIGLAREIFQFVSKTNREVSRFLDAARYADFGQRFEFEKLGAGFDELGNTFTEILSQIRNSRHEQQSKIHHLGALLEHVPVPLISIQSDDSIVLWNNSARRLFGASKVNRISDLEQFGPEFFGHIKSIKPGEQRVTVYLANNVAQQLKISASEITIASETERLISLQNIQSELDGMQLSAWQDLVRVLTHEIMNSMTPVTSLAKTAAQLVDEASRKIVNDKDVVEALVDAREAVDTVARRSDGLLKFVSSYRQLTRLPIPQITVIKLESLFNEVARVATHDWLSKGIGFMANIEPNELDIQADRQMIEQVLINLLRNSEQALEDNDNGQVNLSANLNSRGQVSIEITDNGPGIPFQVASKIFVPFFTTRREGSGVGLALSRQIMIAHGGSITFTNSDDGGARFTLVFGTYDA